MADTIGDMLTRIRNAQAAKQETLKVPYSNFGWALAKLLEREGFIASVDKLGRKEKRTIEITLKYGNKAPTIQILRRISTPGKRVSRKSADISLRRRILTVISTPKGLMTDREARKTHHGGEVICEVGYTER